MSQFDDDLMFSDGQQIAAATANILSVQSIWLRADKVLGFNAGVGGGLFIEVYGFWSGAFVTAGLFTLGVVTDDNEGLTSATNIFTDLNLATTPTALTVPSRLACIPVPTHVDLEEYLGLQYTFTAATATQIMNVTAGITRHPTLLRDYGNNLKIS
jgi:hypothetical protein